MLRRALVVTAVGFALLAAPAARAQDEKTDKQTRQKANRHFKNGVGLFDEGKYAEALAEFEAAYTLAPHPLVLYNLASCHRALSQYDQAVTYYDRFLETGPSLVDQELLDKARKELDDVLALVAMVTVTTSPSGASIKADGRPLGETPLDNALVLGPGDHVIEAELEGHKLAQRTIRVAAGDSLKVEIDLRKLEDPTPIGSDDVRVQPDLPGSDPTVTTVVEPAPPPRTIGLTASFGTNLAEIADTGVPGIGVDYPLGGRMTVGLDVTLVAFAVIPNVRYRLAGNKLSVHAVGAVPVAFTDGDDSDVFAGVAGGLGVRMQATPKIALRVETWVSYAGSDHGTTVPTFAGAELWF